MHDRVSDQLLSVLQALLYASVAILYYSHVIQRLKIKSQNILRVKKVKYEDFIINLVGK